MPDFATLTVPPPPAAEAAERAAGRWLSAVRRGLDLLVAFATLRAAESADDQRERLAQQRIAPRRRPPEPLDPPRAAAAAHPHRRALRAGRRGRRPGAVPPRAHACRSPLTATRPA